MKTTEEYAELYAGNWLKIRDYANFYLAAKEKPETWAIYNFGACDNMLTESNRECIEKSLKRYIGRKDIELCTEHHWAVGRVDGLYIKVYTKRGKITKAFESFAEIMQKLEDYPVFDESDYSQRLQDYCSEIICDALKRACAKADDVEYSDEMYCEFTDFCEHSEKHRNTIEIDEEFYIDENSNCVVDFMATKKQQLIGV